MNAPQHQSASQFLNGWLDGSRESAGIARDCAPRGAWRADYDQAATVTPELLTDMRRIGPFDPGPFSRSPRIGRVISVFFGQTLPARCRKCLL